MKKQKLHNRKYLKPRRKELRNKLTPAEAALWKVLQKNKVGLKFRRQHSIENYIVDFYCPEENLIIELDGEVHNNLGISLRDDDRSKRLNELGYTIIRFKNKTVFENTEGLLEVIKAHMNKK